jgi:hypothetical protein
LTPAGCGNGSGGGSEASFETIGADDTSSTGTSGGDSAGDGDSTGDGDSGDGDGTGSHPMFPPPELGGWTGEDFPTPTPSPSLPGQVSGIDATHYGGLSCGPFPENLFDILVPNSGSGHPLLVYIHGGGFTGGSRLTAFTGKADEIESYVNAGFAYASIDYRFRTALGEGVRTSLQDAQVCLQFILHHAADLGLDPERVVLAGNSAGAGTSLWLNSTDDLADPASGHAILSQSTDSIDGIIIDGTQATYDLLDWIDVVFGPEYSDIMQAIADAGGFDDEIIDMYGLAAGTDVLDAMMNDPDVITYRQATDMLDMLDADDAPIRAETTNPDEEPLSDGIIKHHPYHVRAIGDAAAAVGLETVLVSPGIGENATETRTEFALRMIGGPSGDGDGDGDGDGTSTGDGDGDGTCPPEPTDTPCSTCAKSVCCAEYETCYGVSDCACIADCFATATMTPNQCAASCGFGTVQDQAEFAALYACAMPGCTTACAP